MTPALGYYLEDQPEIAEHMTEAVVTQFADLLSLEDFSLRWYAPEDYATPWMVVLDGPDRQTMIVEAHGFKLTQDGGSLPFVTPEHVELVSAVQVLMNGIRDAEADTEIAAILSYD